MSDTISSCCVDRCELCQLFGVMKDEYNKDLIATYVCDNGQSNDFQHIITNKHKICVNLMKKSSVV